MIKVFNVSIRRLCIKKMYSSPGVKEVTHKINISKTESMIENWIKTTDGTHPVSLIKHSECVIKIF